MPPRKKLNASSSKKSAQNNSQSSKYGIQHFFERHSQNPNKNASTSSIQNPKLHSCTSNSHISKPIELEVSESGSKSENGVVKKGGLSTCVQNPKNGVDLKRVENDGFEKSSIFENGGLFSASGDHNAKKRVENGESEKIRVSECMGLVSALGDQIPKKGFENGVSEKIGVSVNVGLVSAAGDQNPKLRLKLGSENTPPENLLIDLTNSDDVVDVSPEFSKCKLRKRAKFSPGMLIKQSQDDGGEEVTWRITPVNERLQAISKLAPDVVKALADASRRNSSAFQQLSDNSGGKVHDVCSTSTMEAARTYINSNDAVLKMASHGEDIYLDSQNGSMPVLHNTGSTSTQSPYRTPPSLSYRHDKPTQSAIHNEGLRECTGLRLHKRDLLELLDQVENAISIEGSPLDGQQLLSPGICNILSDGEPIKANSCENRVAINAQKEAGIGFFDPYFLVLEVTEQRATTLVGGQCSLKVLRVLNEQSGVEQSVHLWDEWFYSVIEPGDTIRVIGEFDKKGNCDVNHDNNLLIIHPNLLLSGTRIAGSFSCPRRAVLDERLKCGEYATAALTGTLLHQIFQAGLLMENPTIELLEEFSKLTVQKNIETLYACGVQEFDMRETLNNAIPRLCNWILHFRDSQNSDAPTVDFGPNGGLVRVTICEVVDIEEMAWAPKYGLKGIIDASLRVKMHSNHKEANEVIMPLEFKTGKATSGQSFTEHSAQLILYTLLLSERYMLKIDSGLLYYLSTDQTLGTSVQRSDLIGLIMRRNELAHSIIKALSVQQLPPMLQSSNMCKGCRHLNACAIHHKVHGGSAENSGLGDLFESLTDHLTAAHKVFFKQWERLIDLEAKELQLPKHVRKKSYNSKNESISSCLTSLVLDASEELHIRTYAKDERFVYRFVHKDSPFPNQKVHNPDSESAANDLHSSLRSGDRVILSTESNNLAVASGVITHISRSHVAVSFSKRLRLPRSTQSSMSQDLFQEIWRIEKDELATAFATMRFNLVQLFLQSAQSDRLRKLIVDAEAPRFDGGSILSQDPAISYIWSEKNLNADQRRAIIKILTAKDYALILGMPGTGKTSTLVYAIKALLMRGASVLLTSYTNSAVDNLLIKLKIQGIDFLRIGRCEAVHKEIQGHCLSDMDIHSVEEIKLKLDQVRVVAVTCLGITSPLLVNKKFDVCIIDEAGQTSLPVSLGPLMFSSKFVLVGDHYQLPPLVTSAEARESGMSVSLFRRLSEGFPQAISALQSQYRMCAGIMKLSNALIYGEKLRCGSEDVENAKIKLSNKRSLPSWLMEVLDADKPVIFINTDILPAFETRDKKIVTNPIEAYIVAEITEALVNHGVEKRDIGIITPYNSQATLIQHVLNMDAVEVHTIDKYQGRDKDCIILSFVRSAQKPSNCTSSLLDDWHRINVALTRAKKKLIMLGSCKTLSRVPLLKLLIEKVEDQSGIFCITRKDFEPKMELKRCSQNR
ncbi:DNA replication ATP-dependent helicase/nuclease JHS1 [Amaranthus tricolor]|uniref:DNA replication ATP-dependent helicase/nuclease JHS1 n=1 Tax=Amaranthus tricolor TaxID=29722 RepID=UPI00258FD054|nr:DNA replication ATP-dependent helicase/nuclease JHS1 [Amaranthus tricolor]